MKALNLRNFALVAVIFCLAGLAQADITYNYTGNAMACVGGCPGPTLTLHGSMTLSSPLAAGLFFQPPAGLVSYDFVVTGGAFTSQHFTQAAPGPDSFLFITDPGGVITGWQISFNGALETAFSQKFGGGIENFADSTGPGASFSASNTSPGTWTIATTAPVPEPSALLLMGSGMAGLAGAIRRRIRR